MATSEPPRSRRRLLYLYSTRNMVASGLALLGLVLFFLGVVGWVWPFVVVALYLIGVLVVPARRTLDMVGSVGASDLGRALEDLLKRIRNKVPSDIEEKVQAIAATISGVLPRVGQLAPGSQERFVLERTVEDYLPRALQAYVNLPRLYATVHPIQDGKTARQVLGEQLDLLQEQMNEVADAVARNDTDTLLAHGRFLEEKFGRTDLTLGSGDPPRSGQSPGGEAANS